MALNLMKGARKQSSALVIDLRPTRDSCLPVMVDMII